MSTEGFLTSATAMLRSMKPSSSGSKDGFKVFSPEAKGKSDLCSRGTRCR